MKRSGALSAKQVEASLMEQVLVCGAGLGVGQRWGIGLSGGMDSITLAEAMHRAGLPLVALHLDHGWRAESGEDAAWVKSWCRERKLPVRTGKLRTAPGGEAEAREARFRFFRKHTEREGLAGVWLAQHADDLVETFFLQLMRGAGPAGLAGLQADRVVDGLRLVRPWLGWEKRAVARVARRWKLDWREDASNRSDRHRRNRVRHRLLPYLRRWMDRDPVPLILRSCQILADENDYLADQLPDGYPDRVRTRDLKGRHIAWQRRYLHGWLMARHQAGVTFQQIESIRMMLVNREPAKVNLSGEKHVRRTGGELYIE